MNVPPLPRQRFPVPTHTIRLLTPDDANAYTILRREMLADSPWAFLRSPQDDPGCNAAGLMTSLSKPTGFAIAAAFAHDQPTTPVAVAGIVRSEPIKAAHRALIWGVYTSPTHRGHGLARSIIAAAIEAARAWPVTPRVDCFTLSVSEKSTAAYGLYLSMGFVPWGTEPDAVRLGDGKPGYAEVHMQLRA